MRHTEKRRRRLWRWWREREREIEGSRKMGRERKGKESTDSEVRAERNKVR